jgi:hypothetical protein
MRNHQNECNAISQCPSKIKADLVLQETLRIAKQDWVELNLTTQETLYGINANEVSDYEIKIS